MLIRRELPAEAAAVRAVHEIGFARPDYDPVEPGLLDALRADEGWLPALSLIAVDPSGPLDEGAPVGHVVCTRGRIGTRPALGLGPVAVLPEFQGRGTGSALVNAVCVAADALGEPVVVLLGDPAFYSRLGFRTASDLGIEAPDPAWGVHFMARPLTAFDPERDRGPFRYAEPFAAL